MGPRDWVGLRTAGRRLQAAEAAAAAVVGVVVDIAAAVAVVVAVTVTALQSAVSKEKIYRGREKCAEIAVI